MSIRVPVPVGLVEQLDRANKAFGPRVALEVIAVAYGYFNWEAMAAYNWSSMAFTKGDDSHFVEIDPTPGMLRLEVYPAPVAVAA